jgi:hypothetical protein
MDNPMIGKYVRVFGKDDEGIAGIHNYSQLVCMDKEWVILKNTEHEEEDGQFWFTAIPTREISSMDTIGWDIYRDEDMPEHITKDLQENPQDMSDFNEEELG